ncbi:MULTISPECIES: beta-ketoacyl synthase N-terminal-like domain-containing protein [unclassified Streptomyces]|uniref:beta-ketoacyl synthase N-terminal-like domain-containing protein n=1 Tax=unclassified Streptomyces TaxID=2593676 RepID=UPI004042FB9E
MDDRDILTRFKTGTLDRAQAARLLERSAARAAAAAPARPRTPAPADAPEHRPAADTTHRPRTGTGPGTGGGPGATPAATLNTAPPARTEAVDDRCAVVGLAGRYPQAPDLHAHWENLRGGRNTSSAAPASRPGASPLAAGQRGHFLDGVDGFDAEFFGITPAEGALMDPQERLFLEVAWEALEDAGCTGPRLDALTGPHGAPRALGVFVGAGASDYALLGAEAWARGGRQRPSSGHSALTGRLVTLLGLNGPSQAVDTAESSALTALHLAVGALRRGECAAALVGGVELLLHPSRARDLAGEGVGAVVLKPLDRALADGDQVHAVVRATATGVVEPDPQTAGPSGASLYETRETTVPRTGDAGAATGLAALTAAVLQLRHGLRLPPHGSGADAAPWPRPRDAQGRELPRTAVVEVSAEGCPTSRAVVEEYMPPRAVRPERAADDGAGRDELVLLSAPTPAHLTAGAARLADWLCAVAERAPGEEAFDLAAVARVLRAGRAAQPCRIALVAGDVPRLAGALRHFADTGTPGAGVHYADLRSGGADPLGLNTVPETRDYLAALWRGGRVEQLTRLWLSGLDIDWAALDPGPRAAGAAWAPPPSVFLHKPLWLDSQEPAGTDGRTERPA